MYTKICVLGWLILSFASMSASDKQDHYEILGITRVATKADIKRVYRELALKYHPDRNKSEGAEEIFKEVGAAYGILSDDDQRKKYDEGVGNATQSSCHKRSGQESSSDEPRECKKAKEEDSKASCDNHAENVGQKKSETKVEESVYREKNYFQARYNKLTEKYELI